MTKKNSDNIITSKQIFNCVEYGDTKYCVHRFVQGLNTSFTFVRLDGKGIASCDVIENWGYINSVIVRDRYQRQGVCGEILNTIEKYFRKELGISSFYLNCNNDWHVKCYKKYGYVVSEDREGIEDNEVKMFKEENDFH